MVSVEYDVPIKRPPTDVFNYVTQVERIPEWQHQAGVKNVTKTSDGPLAVGSKFRMERVSRGQTAWIDCTVTAFEPDREFDFTSIDSAGFKGDFRTTLTPNAGGTNLHWSVKMEPPNLLYRLLQPMIKREIVKSADVDFANLRQKVESGSI